MRPGSFFTLALSSRRPFIRVGVVALVAGESAFPVLRFNIPFHNSFNHRALCLPQIIL